MLIFVRLLGIVVVVLGVIFLISPDAIKKYMDFWAKGKRIYPGGVLTFLIAIILLLAASEARLTWFVALLGILSLIKGILLFVLGPAKIILMINWWRTRSPLFLRLYALFALALGVLLIYSA